MSTQAQTADGIKHLYQTLMTEDLKTLPDKIHSVKSGPRRNRLRSAIRFATAPGNARNSPPDVRRPSKTEKAISMGLNFNEFPTEGDNCGCATDTPPRGDWERFVVGGAGFGGSGGHGGSGSPTWDDNEISGRFAFAVLSTVKGAIGGCRTKASYLENNQNIVMFCRIM